MAQYFLGQGISEIIVDEERSIISSTTQSLKRVSTDSGARRYRFSIRLVPSVEDMAMVLSSHYSRYGTNKSFFIPVPQIPRQSVVNTVSPILPMLPGGTYLMTRGNPAGATFTTVRDLNGDISLTNSVGLNFTTVADPGTTHTITSVVRRGFMSKRELTIEFSPGLKITTKVGDYLIFPPNLNQDACNTLTILETNLAGGKYIRIDNNNNLLFKSENLIGRFVRFSNHKKIYQIIDSFYSNFNQTTIELSAGLTESINSDDCILYNPYANFYHDNAASLSTRSAGGYLTPATTVNLIEAL